MSDEMAYFIYLLERYGAARQRTGGSVLAELDDKGLTDEVLAMYDLYHIERLDNAFDDLDRLLATGKHHPSWLHGAQPTEGTAAEL